MTDGQRSRSVNITKRKKRPLETLVLALIWASALVTVAVLAAILWYILSNGLPHISWRFLTDTYDMEEHFGILPMLINTLYIVLLTLLIALPIGIGAAIYLTEYAKQGRLVKVIRFTTEILSGIPSIIFGLFGFMFFVMLCGLQYSILAGALTLTLITLPTLIRTVEESLKAVPVSYREGALALGASKLRIIFTILLPSAMHGILSAVILSMGRMVGESAALMFTSGIVYFMPKSLFGHIFSSGRTLTLHLYQLTSLGKFSDQAFATAAVLLVVVFLLNLLASLAARLLNNNKGGK